MEDDCHDNKQARTVIQTDLRRVERELRILINERHEQYKQRFEGQEKATNLALQNAKEAVSKSEISATERFNSVNEFRGQQKDMIATLVTRAEFEAKINILSNRTEAIVGRQEFDQRFKNLEDRITAIKEEAASLHGKLMGANWVWAALVAIAALVFYAISAFKQH